MAAAGPSPAEAKALFKAFLREARKFPNYNIREYVKRRAKEGFRECQSITDPSAAAAAFADGKQQLEVAKRQSIPFAVTPLRAMQKFVNGVAGLVFGLIYHIHLGFGEGSSSIESIQDSRGLFGAKLVTTDDTILLNLCYIWKDEDEHGLPASPHHIHIPSRSRSK
ncbi:hypothetical protein R1sor_016860 [Riccia sorocarpa]|uniref:Complex 1 LYR protein domain-containing protein n=1 Tax=Riccia sorocarpa TaxID=122646 RepID=A0ABD3HKC7_9MARC